MAGSSFFVYHGIENSGTVCILHDLSEFKTYECARCREVGKVGCTDMKNGFGLGSGAILVIESLRWLSQNMLVPE